ncbi:hypothetical protein P1P75_05875 [Streptomyces sp. ID05-39B]|uniref:hypothetical protein n=1 Tax=Streptomyces sp. ID05-39B TaxID=3028664 RepID=UPI0029B95876|nr:hypothetical protein [Streptomyces sp. ID05-39B]MDX3525974.1 hypothetical protein [Streptomyces sp. ID05-39B]
MTAADPWAALRENGVVHLMITAADVSTVRAVVDSLGQHHTVQEPDVRSTSDGVIESQLYLHVGGSARRS